MSFVELSSHKHVKSVMDFRSTLLDQLTDSWLIGGLGVVYVLFDHNLGFDTSLIAHVLIFETMQKCKS